MNASRRRSRTASSARWRAIGCSGALGWFAVVGACTPRPAPAPPPTAAAPATGTALDDFENPAAWMPEASDGVVASADSVPGVAGNALRLSFDFRGHGGHAGVRRSLPVESFPPNYEISFFVRGDAPVNDLQFKLVDASGDNVWWFRQRAMTFPSGWQQVRIKKRQVEFAWGPTKDRELRRSASLELVLAAGEGGRGTVAFDGLALRELPVPPAVPPTPLASASTNTEAAAAMLDGRLDTAWQCGAPSAPAPSAAPAASAGEQWVELDLGYEREFGGLILRWAPGAFASRYDVELSSDREHWRRVREVTAGNGDRDALLLPESEARFVRLRLYEGPAATYALAEVEVRDLAFGATPNAFLSALASEVPRGRYPRAYVGQQGYWTLVGVDGGSDSGLLSEDGALELHRGGISVEPFVRVGTELVSWADVERSQSLADGYLPIPSVTWRRSDWELRVTALAAGDTQQAEIAARYDLINKTRQPLELALLLAVRPLQVNPPTQFLNQSSGFSPIRELDWQGQTLRADSTSLLLSNAPARVSLAAFDAAEFPDRLPTRFQPGSAPAHVRDATGMASALFEYPLSVQPGASVSIAVAAPLLGPGRERTPPEQPSERPTRLIRSLAELDARARGVAASWHEKLDRVKFRVPPAGQALIDTLRSSLAHILISRDGAMLRPGTRSYARSWIRDGAMMSESLLRLGHDAAAASYFDVYAPFQFEGGKVPCCVDARGADPVPEHDSAGEFIFLAAELHRFTRDRARLERAWPRVLDAARYLETLRQHERTAQNQAPDRRHLYGLLPPSISHEGYSDKPAYSYWDDFWALIGYQDAAWLAESVGDSVAHERLLQQRDEFTRDLYASLRATADIHKIPFLAGAADRGDFDATSTTIALAPGREAQRLPRDLLLATFERYWDEFDARRSGSKSWGAYTPYELRVAGSFIRLGWRERAQMLFEYFMADRRPPAWNQWAEVVGRDAREPRFIGDMPHAWISSDYIRSVLDMFAYARDADGALVIGAGIPASWLDGPGLGQAPATGPEAGVELRGLRTPYGPLDVTIVPERARWIVTVAGPTPPGGCVIQWPGAA
ncbi:MAG TPA: discoidin domain-containing protein, partial [Polyangiaceae bacterium]|nr:discoidin domain-containing protein [Polyangiaceae bacterium]